MVLLLFGLLGLVGYLQMLVGVLHALLPNIVNKGLESFLLGGIVCDCHNHVVVFFQFGGIVPKSSHCSFVYSTIAPLLLNAEVGLFRSLTVYHWVVRRVESYFQPLPAPHHLWKRLSVLQSF